MATDRKNICTHRFDFGSAVDDKQTGTIKELLAEINEQNVSGGDLDADIKSLGTTLEFLSHFVGTKYKRTKESLPLSTLKTIKLLYVTNGVEYGQMFRLIQSPYAGEKATMESATGSTIARDKHGARVIQALSDQLALEIGAEKLSSLHGLLKGSEKRTAAQQLNAHIEKTNDEIEHILKTRIGRNNLDLARAYSQLADSIDRTNYLREQSSALPPLNETLFAHIQSLGFLHFAKHHQEFINAVRVGHRISPICDEVNALCRLLSELKGSDVFPTDQTFSVNNFHHVVFGYPKEFKSLVKAATGLDTRKTTLLENTKRARFILISNAFRRYDETDLNAPRVSVYDIVAALCSIRYQQKVKTEYPPYWFSQVSPGKSPQRNLDKAIEPDDPYMHQGVLQIYLYRYAEYEAAFTHTNESYHAWMAYQVSRFDAYARILQLKDLSGILLSANHFDEFCRDEAMSIAETLAASEE